MVFQHIDCTAVALSARVYCFTCSRSRAFCNLSCSLPNHQYWHGFQSESQSRSLTLQISTNMSSETAEVSIQRLNRVFCITKPHKLKVLTIIWNLDNAPRARLGLWSTCNFFISLPSSCYIECYLVACICSCSGGALLAFVVLVLDSCANCRFSVVRIQRCGL